MQTQLVLLTGIPGTGKTTMENTSLGIMDLLTLTANYLLTGQDICKRFGSGLYRFLRSGWGGVTAAS